MLSKNGGYPKPDFLDGGHVNHRGVGVPFFQTRLLMPSSGEELCSRQRSYMELPRLQTNSLKQKNHKYG